MYKQAVDILETGCNAPEPKIQKVWVQLPRNLKRCSEIKKSYPEIQKNIFL